MLRYVTFHGSLEATAADERRVRAYSDAALCGALNGAAEADLFLLAEAEQRPGIYCQRQCGWRPRPPRDAGDHP